MFYLFTKVNLVLSWMLELKAVYLAKLVQF